MCSSLTYGIALVLALFQSLQTLAKSNVYIVYMGERRHDNPQLVQESHHDFLSHVLGSKEVAKQSILYSYKHGFSGFAAILNESHAKLIADLPGVAGVIQNKVLSLHTTRSWDFLQVKPYLGTGFFSNCNSGVGSIIGVLDTGCCKDARHINYLFLFSFQFLIFGLTTLCIGIWPESKSFADEGIGGIPSRWKGICQEGEGFNSSHCNRKIIGARWYIKGYEAEFGKLDTGDRFEFLSPRDAEGHGTHTSSTAAGAPVVNASFMGLAKGLARGGAPSAWLAIYKVCWATGECSSADLLAAFDDAVFDGVDVLSVSLGSSPPLATYVEDPVAIGSFHATAKGISVVCSAGNAGPFPQTVTNTAPWLVTVAASTIDRAFPVVITLGNNKTVVGQALYTGKSMDNFYPIVNGEDIAASNTDEESARACESGSLNATLARGKVILCFQSRTQRSGTIAKRSVADVEAVGLIFAQFPNKDVILSVDIPCVQVDFVIGTYVLTYMEKNRNPIVKFGFTKTTIGQQIAPKIAFFSSRGPSSLSPTVLKPDIAAPGVNILAAWSPAASVRNNKKVAPLIFKLESGTSMACPHISGIIALLKAIHPEWSPAAVKSALVTTASIEDEYGQNIVAEGAPHKQADPFDYGGGHVDPNKAISPGLIYDMETSDYITFLCSMGYNDSAISLMTQTQNVCKKPTSSLLNLNLPAITIPELKNKLTVSRTVTNVGPVDSVYVVRVRAPVGTDVRVKPSVMVFNSSVRKLKFKVTFSPKLRIQGRYSFGNLYWEDGFHVVRIALVVRTVIDYFYPET